MNNRRSARFSIATLLLLTSLIACAVSHFLVSKELANTKEALTSLRNDALVLDVNDNTLVNVLALPDGGSSLAWRWKMQLPLEGDYRLKYGTQQIPETGLPPKSDEIPFGAPLPTGTPFTLAITLFKDVDDVWRLKARQDNGGVIIALESPPPWLDSEGIRGGYVFVRGKGQTTSSSGDSSPRLLTIRKRKQTGPRTETINMDPTDGISIWIERIN